MLNKTLGRFVTRPTNPNDPDCNQPDLFVGAFLKNQSEFDAHTVYEIYGDFTGQILVKEIGECSVDRSVWNSEIQYVMKDNGNKMLVSKEESGYTIHNTNTGGTYYE